MEENLKVILTVVWVDLFLILHMVFFGMNQYLLWQIEKKERKVKELQSKIFIC